ncbi:hypothetical protein NAC44_01950 [Allorhizobium sp. BGMRC 0089]|uniref:hypothetical protein n=1 Tax=Allorhizobium sonneratiae TaxID=2934936 RepID=UPI0020334B44|nr:hypothetical protein [Allorhizobium sonneratiae]MCM2291091.1 hypothetical protein [Allorhizobium sonneratiae]
MAKTPQAPQHPLKQSYRYSGPVTALDVEGEASRLLFPGTSYRDLPDDSIVVQNLIERRLLVAETGTNDAATVTAEPSTASEGA